MRAYNGHMLMQELGFQPRCRLSMDCAGVYHAVFKGVVVNYTEHPQRRFTFALGVAPEADLAEAQRVAVAAVAAVPGVLADPSPTAFFQRLGESTVDLTVAGWLDQRSHDFFRTRSEA